jgi:Tol biopolymer transport system component
VSCDITRFTFDAAADVDPVWSPDASRIVWASNGDGFINLYEKAASGAGQDALLLKSEYFKFPTDWSRDGRFIIYREVNPKTKYDVWVLPVGTHIGDQKPFPLSTDRGQRSCSGARPNGQCWKCA